MGVNYTFRNMNTVIIQITKNAIDCTNIMINLNYQNNILLSVVYNSDKKKGQKKNASTPVKS